MKYRFSWILSIHIFISQTLGEVRNIWKELLKVSVKLQCRAEGWHELCTCKQWLLFVTNYTEDILDDIFLNIRNWSSLLLLKSKGEKMRMRKSCSMKIWNKTSHYFCLAVLMLKDTDQRTFRGFLAEMNGQSRSLDIFSCFIFSFSGSS